MAANRDQGRIVEYSKNCRYLCHSDTDGVLKIWDTITGTLKQEYAPSSHLSVQCTCVSWGPSNPSIRESSNKSPKKKKRKFEKREVVNEIELIALGTSDGSILLYDVNEAKIQSQLEGGHQGIVTGVCWSSDGSKLYSCSEDEHIIEWDLNEMTIEHKWKSKQGKLTSIALCYTQCHLLTASESIQLWDLKTRKVLQTFIGHTTAVTKLLEVPHNKQQNNSEGLNNSMECDDGIPSVKDNYIVSMAKGENKISVRQIGLATTRRSVELLASFLVSEEPIQMNVNVPTSDKQMVEMVVVTKHGKVAYFESVLNGRQKKPIQAKQITTIVAKNGEKKRALPVVAAGFNPNDGSLCLIYEDFILPVFETIPTNELRNELVRKDPRTYKLPIHKNDKKIKVDEKEAASTTGKTIRLEEMTLGERLAAEEKMLEAKPNAKTIKTDGAAILLAQGLRSRDKKILNVILQKTDLTYIRTTITELPMTHIGPLVVELHRRLSGHAQSGKTATKWMRSVMSIHSAYLTTVPSIQDLLEPLSRTLEPPTQMFSKLFQLRGRLECFVSQKSLPKGGQINNNDHFDTFACEINHDDDVLMEEVRIEATSEDEWEEDDFGN